MKKNCLILVHTGTPKSCSPDDVALYLKEFLSDPMVVPMPKLLWHPILNGIILPKRKFVSAKRYELIWTEAGSPLLVHTKEIVRKLSQALGGQWDVCCAMRYGEPSLSEVIASVSKKEFAHILVMPLFAQDASQTTGSIMAAVDEIKEQMHLETAFVRVPAWFNDSGYINALAQSVRPYIRDQKSHLVVSFHGLPLKGSSVYVNEVKETMRLLKRALELQDDRCTLAFQSKFGHGKWLSPTTEEVLIRLAKEGVKDVAVVCPGFSVDCLETLEEIAIGLKETFILNGGDTLSYIPALNASQSVVAVYKELVLGTMEKLPSTTK